AALAAELAAGLVLGATGGAVHPASSVERRRALGKLGPHHPRARPLARLGEAVVLVQADRRVVGLDAEADLAVAGCPRPLEQGGEQLLAEAAASAAGDDRDRQLRRLLVDEPVAGLVLLEEPVPGCPD